jgi:hypothetical protein
MNMHTLQLERIISPGMALEQDEQETLVSQLTQVAQSAFGTHITEEDVRNHVLTADVLYLLRTADEPVGFSAYTTRMHDGACILYLSGIAVQRELQGSGFFNRVNQLALAAEQPDYFAMRTQNPVIYGATKKFVGKIYPNGETIPEHIKAIGALFAGLEFDPETFICRRTYGTCLYDRVPEYSGARAFFDGKLGLNYAAGDSIVIVGTTE